MVGRGGTGAALTSVRVVAETGSTNTDLLASAREGAAEGLWLRAERQTAGRGRQGRPWSDGDGNLFASTLVRLRSNDPTAATLALVAAVALQETAVLYIGSERAAVLKWPNDVMIDGAKLAGILLEREGDAVVVGFGVNLASAPNIADRPATSLDAQGARVSPDRFCETLAQIFAGWLARWRGEGLAPVRDRWLARAFLPGTALTARLADGEGVDGLFDGLTADGALILRLADGGRRVIHAGDVFLL